MKVTAIRWYPILIMRDQLGRFASLRVALGSARRPVRRPLIRRRVQLVTVQLVLF